MFPWQTSYFLVKGRELFKMVKLFELNTSLILNHSKFLQLDIEPEMIKLKTPLNMIHVTLSNIHLYPSFGALGGKCGYNKNCILQVGISVEVKLLVIHQKQLTPIKWEILNSQPYSIFNWVWSVLSISTLSLPVWTISSINTTLLIFFYYFQFWLDNPWLLFHCLTMFVSFIQQIVYTGLFCISQDFSQVTALLLFFN